MISEDHNRTLFDFSIKETFHILIESYHIGDKGQSGNVHELGKKELDERTVVPIDIVNDPVHDADYKEDEDPIKFVSKKTGRAGPFKEDWIVRFY